MHYHFSAADLPLRGQATSTILGAMHSASTTNSSTHNTQVFDPLDSLPELLIAFAPQDTATAFRCEVRTPFLFGRRPDCSFSIEEGKISRRHFVITQTVDGYFIEDLQTTNGTFIGGERILKRTRIDNNTVIRVGNTLMVFQTTPRSFLSALEKNTYNLAGRFYPEILIREVREAARGDRPILLAGPSGSGKELAARILATIYGEKLGRPLPMIAHNAARFSSEEDAESTLFGVAEGVFTNVKSRPGLIEAAKDGILFLDEIHNLPERIQRSLLRVLEDRQMTRLGSMEPFESRARFTFGANEPAPTYGLAPDLLARLRVVKVLPLCERIADIPSIFDHVLARALERQGLRRERVIPFIDTDVYETLCLNQFPNDNVRGLIDLADRLATRIAEGTAVSTAISSVLFDRFGNDYIKFRRPKPSPSGERTTGSFPAVPSDGGPKFEFYKMEIIHTYYECAGNICETVRMLKKHGIHCSRQGLARYLDKWGVRPIRSTN